MQKGSKQSTLSSYFRTHHLVLLLAIIVGIYALSSMFTKNKYVPETQKTEIHKLPHEAERRLKQASSSATLRVPILLYHYVEYVQDKKDTIRQSLNILPNTLEQQIQTLQDAGYTFITAKDLGAALDDKQTMPDKPILLTFDDGHWDLYTYVLPILQKYQVKATAYIIPGFLNGSDFLSKKQVQLLAASGLVEIGAHTVHHLWLKGRSHTVVQHEVEDSKTMLESLLHTPVVSFAYPYGAFDQQAEDEVRSDGFETAVTTVPGIQASPLNRFFLYRIRPGARTGQVLLNFLSRDAFPPW